MGMFQVCNPSYTMGFDKDSNLPLVDPQKRTTKVNFSVVIGVVVFLLFTVSVVIWYSKNQPTSPPANLQQQPK